MKLPDELIKLLSQEEQPEPFQELFTSSLQLVQESRSAMAQRYSQWDTNYNLYKATRFADEEDRQRKEHNEPQKMVLPLIYSQVETFAAFAYMVITQNKRIFEFDPQGPEDHLIQEFAEVVIQKDLNYNQFKTMLLQWLRQIAIYGVAIWKINWKEKFTYLPVEQVMAESSFGGFSFGGATISTIMPVTSFLGNELELVSPYSFFPDTRVALSKFQNGEFCADEKELARSRVQQFGAEGFFAGVEHLVAYSKSTLDNRRGEIRLPGISKHFKYSSDALPHDCILDVQRDIIPNKFEVNGKFPLGDYAFPVRYCITIGNDNRILRLVPTQHYHGQFTYSKAEMSPDMMQTVGDNVPEMLEKLQDIMTWMVNSRVTSVNRSLEPNMVLDPGAFNMETVKSRSPIILTQKGKARAGIDQFMKQLQVVDTTQGHASDMQIFTSFSNLVTGINSNAQGQYHTGRRSAAESRVVSQGAATRMTAIISTIWEDGLQPLGQQMLTNQRQGITTEEFDYQIGEAMTPEDIQRHAAIFAAFKADPTKLVRNCDLFVFDGTLPSEKNFIAQSLQEILIAMMSNPGMAEAFGLDPKMIFEEIQVLRGVKNLSRFSRPQQPYGQQTNPGQLPAPPQLLGSPSVQV